MYDLTHNIWRNYYAPNYHLQPKYVHSTFATPNWIPNNYLNVTPIFE